MKAAFRIESEPHTEGEDSLIEHLQQALTTSDSSIRAWLAAQIEAALAQIPFLEVALRGPALVLKAAELPRYPRAIGSWRSTFCYVVRLMRFSKRSD